MPMSRLKPLLAFAGSLLFVLVMASPVAGAAGADISVSKSVFSPFLSVDPGAEIDSFISVTNLGDDPANSIAILDAIPANATFVSLTGGCCGQLPATPSVGGTGTVSIIVPGFHAKG